MNSTYNEITKKLTSILNDLKNSGNILTKKEDQDFVYYKTGVNYYKNIHPNQFYKKSIGGSFEAKSYNEMVSALNNIFISFNLSEYYLKRVIEEYPQSPWMNDAKEKIKLLKKLRKSYTGVVIEEKKTVNYNNYMNEMGLKKI